MKVGYVDTSCMVAIALGEPGSEELADVLSSYDVLLASNLFEAELRATLRRESVDEEAALPPSIRWVLPDRPLTPEIRRVLETGYVRGADTWHLACALYAAEVPREVAFLTLDGRQSEAAAALGFPTGP